MSDGSFRFADLTAGTYKLLSTNCSIPIPFSPTRTWTRCGGCAGPLFGYPPVYYPNAPDFASATAISLGAGETETADLSLVKQPYYRVSCRSWCRRATNRNPVSRLRFTPAQGAGFTLGYNPLHHAVEGMLPNGTIRSK